MLLILMRKGSRTAEMLIPTDAVVQSVEIPAMPARRPKRPKQRIVEVIPIPPRGGVEGDLFHFPSSGKLGYGNKRRAFASANHFRNIASVSIISVKPAWLIFTVETIEGRPCSVWP